MEIPVARLHFVLWGLSHSILRERKTPKYFIHWKDCLFFKTLWFQQPPRSLKKCSGKLYSIGRNSLWTLVSCSLRFIILGTTGKEGPKNLSPENSCFLKRLFLSTSKVPKKRWYLLDNYCRNTSWTPIKCCSLLFSCSIKGEKTGHKVFSIGEVAFFLKSLCFHQPLRS